jgi:hypothetical protein
VEGVKASGERARAWERTRASSVLSQRPKTGMRESHEYVAFCSTYTYDGEGDVHMMQSGMRTARNLFSAELHAALVYVDLGPDRVARCSRIGDKVRDPTPGDRDFTQPRSEATWGRQSRRPAYDYCKDDDSDPILHTQAEYAGTSICLTSSKLTVLVSPFLLVLLPCCPVILLPCCPVVLSSCCRVALAINPAPIGTWQQSTPSATPPTPHPNSSTCSNYIGSTASSISARFPARLVIRTSTARGSVRSSASITSLTNTNRRSAVFANRTRSR